MSAASLAYPLDEPVYYLFCAMLKNNYPRCAMRRCRRAHRCVAFREDEQAVPVCMDDMEAKERDAVLWRIQHLQQVARPDNVRRLLAEAENEEQRALITGLRAVFLAYLKDLDKAGIPGMVAPPYI